MTTSPDRPEPLARSVVVTDAELRVALNDGRTISAPLNWFPKLRQATPEARAHWELVGQGRGIQWPDVGEDLSVAGLLAGARAPGASDRGAA